MSKFTKEQLAGMIDHTELKSSSGKGKIKNLCYEAKMFGFISVCVNPHYVKFAHEQLKDSDVIVCSVIGFPLGMNTTEIKALEAKKAVSEGAKEIDMVINVGALRDKDYDFVLEDIGQVVQASAPSHVKVILETCYLTDEEIVKACQLCVEAGAHFVKTSTGFGAFGAFENNVKLMRKTVGPDIGVKASGGISTLKDAIRMIEVGANRLGTSAGVAIIEAVSMLKFAPEAWLEPEIPCHICPVRSANLSKLPKGVYAYYKKKCLNCPHRDKYNKFYE
ncbi:MAG: deoxyribose-phosphate aldolase [Candidatus Cloacimonetes bacterium]|nr:deoxyribose-phosphate aldolase [Candidatus Cloacimonadota bacterium]MCF7812933.1 deoxyribose-phosphate aldolase [Candidatus Cloacimonadota bacterium]MCF7867145.1 deoxyribose-phosphate aldolase [Candidatus Cloacimonadota bacterium]MCF7882535.1 deoxyribose-phosphate aldolase [Candidatus Cloacimonadota bacterium]